MSSAAHTSKVRIYDLAKELKMESKRLIEEVRREGVDVSVPSNTISKELAEKIRNKYFPKKEPTVLRAIRVVKKAWHTEAETPTAPEPTEAPVPEVYAEAEPAATTAPATEQQPADAPTGGAVRPLAPRVKKLAPAARAEHPTTTAQAPVTTAPADGSAAAPAPEVTEADESVVGAEESAPAAEQTAPPDAPESQQQPAQAPAPGRQVRTLRLTDAALKAGVQPGQRVQAPVAPSAPAQAPRERGRGGRDERRGRGR